MESINMESSMGYPEHSEVRMLSWTCHGLSDVWVELHLAPICDRYQDYLHHVPFGGDSVETDDEHHDWDILFLGSESTQSSGQTLESIVRRISRKQALNCVVAVAPAKSLERQLDLMRAGASDVLTLDADSDRVEQALDLAISVVQARRTQGEQEKLHLISQLAVSVNHEINNPLAGLMGTAELLLIEGKDLDEKKRNDLKNIIKQCMRIQEITARLKTLNYLRTVPYGRHDFMLDLGTEVASGPPPQFKPPEEQFLPTPRLLVVDDNPLIIDLIARLFENRFAVDAAACASDALSRVEASAYDLVLIDLILPEMNGLELYRAIRRLRPGQKALLTTAYQGDARVEQAIVEGALGCVYKPFQLEELEKTLTDALKPKET